MRILVYFLFSLHPFLVSLAAQTGAIKGTVVTENGMPVALARVSVERTDHALQQRFVRYAETDVSGHFVLDRLGWGTYYVFARKDEDGYPDTTYAFYSNNDVPKATISAANPVAEATVAFGPKAGSLIGGITDATNRNPVSVPITLTARRRSNPNYFISTGVSPEYIIMAPSETDVLLEVSAVGYRTWNSSSAIHLRPGEEQKLDISLQPVANGTGTK